MSPIRGPIKRIRNTRESETASRSARVFKHEVDVCDHGGHVHRRYLGDPGDEHRLLKVPFCEYAMRGSPRPQQTLIVSSNMKWTYAVTGDMPVICFSEGPG